MGGITSSERNVTKSVQAVVICVATRRGSVVLTTINHTPSRSRCATSLSIYLTIHQHKILFLYWRFFYPWTAAHMTMFPKGSPFATSLSISDMWNRCCCVIVLLCCCDVVMWCCWIVLRSCYCVVVLCCCVVNLCHVVVLCS